MRISRLATLALVWLSPDADVALPGILGGLLQHHFCRSALMVDVLPAEEISLIDTAALTPGR